jgi:cellulose synthase/poly-beta-1,6-N-acetylglucosamine synthase-like glycosyltransferase
MKVLFWLSLLFIFYTYIGYPCLLFIWERLAGRKVNKAYIEPKVSIVIAAHNEEKHIGKKIENCLGLNYPKGMVEVIVVSDGSEDRTNQIAGGFQAEAVRVLHYKERKGKAYALNLGASQAKGEILFFTDARQILEK